MTNPRHLLPSLRCRPRWRTWWTRAAPWGLWRRCESGTPIYFLARMTSKTHKNWSKIQTALLKTWRKCMYSRVLRARTRRATIFATASCPSRFHTFARTSLKKLCLVFHMKMSKFVKQLKIKIILCGWCRLRGPRRACTLRAFWADKMTGLCVPGWCATGRSCTSISPIFSAPLRFDWFARICGSVSRATRRTSSFGCFASPPTFRSV